MPVSFIGIWRWSFWLVRRIAGLFYRPLDRPWPHDKQKPKTSIVVPVYNEDRHVFAQALDSWIAAGVDEVVAVIDYTDIHNIYHFHTHQKKTKTRLNLVVARTPGKRPCLVDGILRSRGDIVYLVDSDTIWSPNVIESTIPYFLDEKIGGVTVRQQILEPQSLSQVLFDMLLYLRYTEEVPTMVTMGHSVNTLSGRTAVYRREALLNEKYDNMHLLTHEHFLKSRCISGDDKRLTHLILEQGWHLAYQSKAVVFTPGMTDLKSFLKQRLRWTRNSWRADSRAFQRQWVFNHPFIAIFNFDRFIQPFFLLFGLSIFILSLIQGQWVIAGVIFTWWTVTRVIRFFGYFVRHPQRIIYLPVYMVFTYWTAIVKLFAWFTIVEQGWITRWHSSRLGGKKSLAAYQGNLLTGLTLLAIFTLAWYWQRQAFIDYQSRIIAAEASPYYSDQTVTVAGDIKKQADLPPETIKADQFKEYIVGRGETLTSISQKLKIPIDVLRETNNIQNQHAITLGQKLYYR